MFISKTSAWKYTYTFFIFLDVHKMRDRFIDSVKGGEEQVTDEGRPVRSFARTFFSALFSIDEEEEINSDKELTSKDKRMEIVVPSPSKTTAVEDDQMLEEVKELPRESKISLLLSIIYGLTGIDEPPTSERLPKMPEETEACREGMPIGVDNRGLDCDEEELRSSQPDPIAGTETHHEIFPNNASPDSRKTNCSSLSLDVVKMNSKPSVVSGDPEPGLSDQSEPKTVRVWLKDPHLYKVGSFCLWWIAKRILNALGVKLCYFKLKSSLLFLYVGGRDLHMYKGYSRRFICISAAISYLQGSV